MFGFEGQHACDVEPYQNPKGGSRLLGLPLTFAQIFRVEIQHRSQAVKCVRYKVSVRFANANPDAEQQQNQ